MVQTETLHETALKNIKSIAEEITEAAELATKNTGFVYDESSGMYYDSNSGYFYRAEYGLYYDANTGTYFSYDQKTNAYEFHSQVQIAHQTKLNTKIVKRKKKVTDRSQISKCSKLETTSPLSAETEEGECSETSVSDSSEDSNSDSNESFSWPPCMRIIVEQSQIPKIKEGSLHIITCEGGTLGREGNHAILLPDINISKSHLKFTYDKEKNIYSAIDLGSRNGTMLNGKRMSSSKEESHSFEVAHGSRIQIGSVVLLCHIHEGSKTCGHCEPGLVQKYKNKIESVFKTSKTEAHKKELKQLRKKFGVNVYEDGNSKLAVGYTDRAQKRRDTVGSQNPHEKTQAMSLTESLSSQNKGFQMLSRMGWNEGQSLGKSNQGILEPIPLTGNIGTTGIGNTEVQQSGRNNIWEKTQERYQNLSSVIEPID